MNGLAIKAEGLGKKYRIGHSLSGDLRETFRNLLKGGNSRMKSNDQNLSEFWALKNINFEIFHGEAIGIIGRNGAGKSTLLKILSRITEPSTGMVEINGRVSSLLEVGTGFHPELTGRENIYLNGTILGMKRTEIKSRFDEIIDFSGVSRFIDTPVKHYSSGMKVRLAFSVAAHLEPEVLLIDEVLAVGDVDFQKKCISKMGQVNSSGKTILFVSHDLKVIKQFCPKSILIEAGEIIKFDSTELVVQHYTGSGLILKNSVQWGHDIDQPGDDVIKLISCRMVDQNHKTINQSSIDEVVGIEVLYKILKEGFEPNPNIHVRNIDSEKLFVTICDTEIPKTVGEHKVIIWFEKNIFNDNRYIFEVAMTTFQPWKLHVYLRDLLSIDFYDIRAQRSSGYSGKFPGQIRPNVKYQF